MKKIIIVVFLLILLIPCMAPAQDLDPIIRDLSAMFEGVGNDILPYLQQTVIAGEGIGRASIGTDSRFYAGFSLGSTFSPGILTFLDEENYFEMLNVSGLLDGALGASEGDSTILDTFSTFFFFPTLRLTAGVRLPLGMDVSALFSIIPGALTGAIANAAGFPGIELRQFNLGVRLRKVLIHDEDGFPAVSIGAGYTYASFGAGFNIGETLGSAFTQEIGGNYLSLDGAINMETAVHTAGVDFILSKKLLVFYPFIKISPWYQWGRYNGSIDGFKAAFYTNEDLSGTPIVETGEGDDPTSLLTKNDLSLILAAGFEVALGKFVLTPSGSFDVGTKRFHANLSMRLQF
jgi:hypothetical protein